MITLTEMIVGEKMDVKPSKIVAGLEPDKTNYFLQRLFQASTAGIDSTPYVKKIMGGDDGGDDEEQERQAQIEAQRQAEEAQRQQEEKRK
jgi:TRAF3-interacting protein 1